MAELLLVRHAEPWLDCGTPAVEWSLTQRGRARASELGNALAARSGITGLWTSPERKARETAQLSVPGAAAVVRHELGEVRRPWYPSAGALRAAVSVYLRGGEVEGWEPHEDVLNRVASVQREVPTTGRVVLVSHGVLITTWLAIAVRLDDPFRFWEAPRLPDAWAVDFGTGALERITMARTGRAGPPAG